MMPRLRRVLIAQETLPDYRVSFFSQLREECRLANIDLVLVHGAVKGQVGRRLNTGYIEWACTCNTKYICIPGSNFRLAYQPIVRLSKNFDLVVVEQANRLLSTYILLVMRRFGGPPVAFWGHGRNLQSEPNTLRERAKRRIATRPNWWFAYTASVGRYLESLGYPRSSITVVNNAIDTGALAAAVTEAKAATDIVPRRCLFLGGLHQYKRLDFLIAAADIVARTLTDFELIVGGDGELMDTLRDAARSRPYLHLMGAVGLSEKATLLATSSLLLMPGMIGLVALDCIIAGLPVVTTAVPFHSPEFEYLSERANVILPADASPTQYADAVCRLLLDPGTIRRLRTAQEATGCVISTEDMAQRFCGGLRSAITSRYGE